MEGMRDRGHNVEALEGELLRERCDLPGLASVLFHLWLAWCLRERGQFREYMTYAEEAVQIAQPAGHPYSLSLAYLSLGTLCLQKGELQQALAALEQYLPRCQGTHFQQLFPLLATPLGAAYALSGRVAEVLPLLEQAVE
jgi:tetratricopeptide (TPR) repeat protein